MNLTEKDVARIWQYQLLESDGLATEDGEPLRIIYPGRPNDEQGADFREAVIVAGRRLQRGDVEIHIKSSGWQEHGHDTDAVYNRVILHVVMRHNAKTATRLQNGREVPVLALEKYVTVPVSEGSDFSSFSDGLFLPCQTAGRLNMDTLANVLDKAGEERFLMKTAWFQRDLTRTEAGQSLYQGIMGALGYSRNKLPFLELAHRVPLRLLESVAQDKIPDTEWLLRRQALLPGMSGLLPGMSGLLLGTSGLLSPQCQDGCPGSGLGEEGRDQPARLRVSLPHSRAMSPDAWHLMRVRPNNSPVLRLAAMSYLLLRCRERGLLEGLVGLVREALPGRGGYKSLEAGLVVDIDRCPASSPDSSMGGRRLTLLGMGREADTIVNQTRGRGSRLTLLGRGRAADIIVNVLLPFTFAWSRSTSQQELGGKALDLYHGYPRLTVNSVERHMAGQLGLDSSLVKSARRQQGLIHIYKNLCAMGRCNRCPLGRLESRNDVQS